MTLKENLPGYEDLLQITPASMIGYGFAVFVMALVIYVLYRDKKDLEDENRQQVKTMLGISDKIVPILQKVIYSLNTHEGVSHEIKTSLTKALEDHIHIKNNLEKVVDNAKREQ